MQHLISQARKHWTTHLPKKVAELRQQGKLEAALQVAAKQAADRIQELQKSGYRQHEAEEVARAEFLILRPEPSAEDDEEAAELRELEREYRKMMQA